MKKVGKGRIPWGHYLLVVLLLGAMLASFFAFTWDNQRRILNQNHEYAHDAAIQTAGWVDDMLEARTKSLNLLSIAVAEKISEPWISQDFLKLLQETSVFDYVEFIDRDGLNHNADGVTSDSSDRKNYLRGIQGETGFHVIYNSRITHETLVNFYAPVRYEGQIIGVLNGMFREESLRQAISVSFFGEDARTFLCMADGTVISSYGSSTQPQNLLDAVVQNDETSEQTLAQIRDAFASHTMLCYTAQGIEGRSNVTIIPVGEDWMLVQTFPSTVAKKMESDANTAGIRLELRLITISLIYVAYLILTNLRKRRQLTWEKVRLSGIVEGLVPLFTRLVIVELDQHSYEYLKGTPSDLPAKGPVASLDQYMAARYLRDEEEGSRMIPPDLPQIQASLGGGSAFLQYEYRIHWDEDHWENASVLSLRQKDGVPESLIFAIQDVTALRRQKDAIQQTLQDAFHAAEGLSRAKSDFLARMSHDMRTPMNAVLGMTAIALSHLDDNDRVQDCLKKIDASGRQLLGLINDVLDMSKIESGSIALVEARFDPADEIHTVLDDVRSAAMGKNIQLNVDAAAFDHRDVLGDPVRFRQVLRNLLDNAVKFTPSGGSVTFRARELPSRTPKSAYYEFVVEDTGVGIDPAFLPKLFEPFSREDSLRGDMGIGLGLPVAQALAMLMNGDIKAESEPGHGSRFTVHILLKLPEDTLSETSVQTALPARVEQAPAPADPEPIARHAGVRVLLVEDNELNMEIAVELLEMGGILVETAENGAEAVSLARKNPPGYYDLIFMDLQMPVMNGYEASREIRKSDREDLLHIPIVAVSANAFQEDVTRAEDVGMNDHVMKPVDLDRLLAALDKWLPRSATKTEPGTP